MHRLLILTAFVLLLFIFASAKADKDWDPCTGTVAKESCGLHGVCTNGTLSGYDCLCECDHQGTHCSSIILDLPRLGSPLGMTDGRISAAQIRLLSQKRCIEVANPGLVCEDIMRFHTRMKYFISSFARSNIFAEVDLKCPHRITAIDSILVKGKLPHFRLSFSDVTGEQFYDAMDACTNKTKVFVAGKYGLLAPAITRIVRILIPDSHISQFISLAVEFYGSIEVAGPVEISTPMKEINGPAIMLYPPLLSSYIVINFTLQTNGVASFIACDHPKGSEVYIASGRCRVLVIDTNCKNMVRVGFKGTANGTDEVIRPGESKYVLAWEQDIIREERPLRALVTLTELPNDTEMITFQPHGQAARSLIFSWRGTSGGGRLLSVGVSNTVDGRFDDCDLGGGDDDGGDTDGKDGGGCRGDGGSVGGDDGDGDCGIGNDDTVASGSNDEHSLSTHWTFFSPQFCVPFN
ncbi:uncharacterized protein LOC121416650 isoform X2 [Lytechinus variegatus]|uniref:uncharacterized protein LOC121416650 isoform X2 n=1 Tax=Lytechinus variegatus TaxID=7654 RepID=UPI001BB155A8|nr:uncharacterized protein LOC121416650 isoform X2 [Lytechinus variegatus]